MVDLESLADRIKLKENSLRTLEEQEKGLESTYNQVLEQWRTNHQVLNAARDSDCQMESRV
jgi:hypothetical protein